MSALRSPEQMKKYIESRTFQIPGGCWLWQGPLNDKGYGVLKWERPGLPTLTRAHRIVYIVYHGEPGSLHVCHRCDVRNCLNPDHLFLGTHSDNMADMVTKGRSPRKMGVDRHNAVLTDAQVLEIRRTYVRGGLLTQKDLAAMYGVCQQTVSQIVRGKRWSHV